VGGGPASITDGGGPASIPSGIERGGRIDISRIALGRLSGVESAMVMSSSAVALDKLAASSFQVHSNDRT